jgi:CBS domain-containing protein
MIGHHALSLFKDLPPAFGDVGARLVAEAMSATLVTVPPRLPVPAAAEIAAEHRIHHLLVASHGRLLGEVCAFDLGEAAPDAVVSECMRAPVITIPVDATLVQAAEVMRAFAVGCLPVTWGEETVGIITRGDLRREGVPDELLSPPACACCGSHEHVRLDRRTGEVTFCLDCLESARAADLGDETGVGD